MEPALHPGDTIFCWSARRSVKRGGLVVFTHPSSGIKMVKRVIGLPGETITVDFGDVVIDGRTDLDQWARGYTFPEGTWEVGYGEVFVLSDNRSATRDDGRILGPLPLAGMFKVFWRWRTRHLG